MSQVFMRASAVVLAAWSAAAHCDAVRAEGETAPQVAAPASTAGEGGGLEEVVVTALRSRTDVQRAPAAVTVLSEDLIREQGITDVRAAQVLVPSARFNADRNATQVFIRGVGSSLNFYWIPETVAINFNGTYVPRFSTAGAFFDLESIQVLPGPQGVLYGRSAGGGVIVINAKRPTDTTETRLNVDYGNYDLLHVEAAQNVRLTDTLSVRGAANIVQRDGYQSLGNFAQDAVGLRLSALYEPHDRLSFYLWGNYYEDKGKPIVAQYEPFLDVNDPWYVPANDPVTGISNSTGTMDFHYVSPGLEASYRFDAATVEYTASYLDQVEHSYRNITGANQIYEAGQRQYTQDLKIHSDDADSLQWLAGLSWYYAKSHFESRFGPNQLGNRFPLIEQRSYSGYVQGTYAVLPALRIVGGARVSRDALELDGSGIACFGPCVYPPISFDRHWTHTDWKAGLELDVAERVMAYASVQTGYAPGTLNTYPDSSTFNKQISPQTLLAYTAGLKSRTAGGALTLNVEGFWYDYEDLIVQQFNSSVGQQTLFNVPKSEIYGLQLTSMLLLGDRDSISLNAAYTHGRYGSFQATPTSRNLDGLQTQYTPAYSGNVAYEHRFDLANGGSMDFRASTYVSTSYWGTFDHSPFTQQGSYTKSDASLTYHTPGERWSFGLWVKNIEDTAVGAARGATNFPVPYRGSTFLEVPRTFGISAGLEF